MRDLRTLDKYRVYLPAAGLGDDKVGAFVIRSPTDAGEMNVIASNGMGWDHVSVARKTRCPNWPEVEHVRRLFFQPDEAVMQYHAPLKDYVDGLKLGHPYCLHLWRPHDVTLPAPPKWMVGGMPMDEAEREYEKALQVNP